MIEFVFRLRVCLHLRPGCQFNIGGSGIAIKVDEVHRQTHPDLGMAGQGVEIISDEDSGFRYSRLTLLMPDRDAKIPSNRLKDVYGAEALAATNLFLDAFRYQTGRHGIQNIQSFDGYPALCVGRQGGDSTVTIGFGNQANGLMISRPYHPDEVHRELSNLLEQGAMPLHAMFMMDAHRYRKNGHITQALINAVIALENIVRQNPPVRHAWIPKTIWRLFHKNNHLELCARRHLRMQGFEEHKIHSVVSAIRERNRVVHAGRRTLRGNIDEYLRNIEEVTLAK